MHVGFDGQRLYGQRLGVGRYIEYLLNHWSAQLHANETCTLFLRKQLPPGDPVTLLPFRTRVLAPALSGILWQNTVLRAAASSTDVLFCPSYSMPLTYRGHCVVAIHSVNELHPGTHPWWYRLTYTPIYRRSARRADRVIVPSQSTKDDIQSQYGIEDDKIDIIPQGADDAFRPIDDARVLRDTRVRFLGADRPYIVFVGKLSQRRNIPTLLRAFARLRAEHDVPHALLLVGPNHVDLPLGKIVSELGLQHDVVQTDGRFASHLEVPPIYNAADMYVNASSYEGFSMTLVEALACGIPVVGVNRSAVKEIAEGAAVLLDELSEETLADAMWTVLSTPSLRADLRRNALQRATRYRWQNCALATLNVLRSVAKAA
jgi:glycosyltransferase involved in cell wall biosynthesis